MPDLLKHWSRVWPLVRKELIEQSAQPRSYLTRLAFVLLVFALFAMAFHQQFSRSRAGDLSVLGSGKTLLSTIVALQFAGVYLFMPAMLSPVLGIERERGTLELLLVSRLRPWQFMAQKLLSRVLILATFMTAGLPLAGIAYSLGGVTVSQLVVAVICLLLAALQVGAWSLYCSAIAPTPMKAALGAYVRGVLVLFVVVPIMTLPLALLESVLHLGFSTMSGAIPFTLYTYHVLQHPPLWQFLLACLPIVLSTGYFFVKAYQAMEEVMRRPSSALVRAQREERPSVALDRRRHSDGRSDLPVTRPIAWREMNHLRWWWRTQGFAAVALFSLIAMMIVIFVFLPAFAAHRQEESGMTVLVIMAFLLGVPLVSTQASGLISGERSRSTLDILLTTPIDRGALLTQKLAGLNLLGWLTWSGAMAASLLESLAESAYGPGRVLAYLGASAITDALLIRIAIWIGMMVGLRLRSQIQAGIITLVLLCAWVFIPGVILGFVHSALSVDTRWLAYLDPSHMLLINEDPLRSEGWLVDVIANSILNGGILLALRAWCLRRARAGLR
ncbi:MAG: ABC transporter permease subunit [Planctomycetes bacterium]|nr:ABC transporter permease subunit [Planctomycetota bacterium]